MQKLCKEYRAEAWAALKGKWLTAIVVLVVYGLLMSVISFTVVGVVLLGGPLTAGTAMFFVKLIRGKKGEIGDLFSGFSNFAGTLVAGLLQSIFVLLWSCLLIIPGIIKSISYSMTFFILNDHPNMTGGDAITLSRKMMDGHKMKYFTLQLSFILWILLGFITCGIAFLWVEPYIQAANAAFYEDLKAEIEPNTQSASPILEDNVVKTNEN